MNTSNNETTINLMPISNISNIDMSDTPRNKDNAPPKLFRRSHIVANCGDSFTSSTSSDSKNIFI